MRVRISHMMLALAVTVVPGCGSSATSESASRTSSWASLKVDANEVESFATLKEMSDKAELVVRGKVVAIDGARVAGSDLGAATAHFVTYQLVVEWAKGPTRKGTVLPVEFFATNGARPFDEWLKDLQSSPFPQDTVYFLREKKDGSNAYRIVNSFGLWEQKGNSVKAPLSDDGSPSKYEAETLKFKSLDDLIKSVS